MIYYALVVFSLQGQVIWHDPRPMSFAECRFRRTHEITFYETLRNTKVRVLCPREDNNE